MFKKYFVFIMIFLCIISSLFSLTNSKSYNNLYFPIKSSYIQTSSFGYRYLNSYHFHNGIDLAARTNTPVYALAGGTVISIGFSSSFGNYIIISYYNGYKSLYGHLSNEFNVTSGDAVTNDSIIGFIGPKYLSNGKLNGITTGPHLHFSLYKDGKCINPLSVNFSK